SASPSRARMTSAAKFSISTLRSVVKTVSVVKSQVERKRLPQIAEIAFFKLMITEVFQFGVQIITAEDAAEGRRDWLTAQKLCVPPRPLRLERFANQCRARSVCP